MANPGEKQEELLFKYLRLNRHCVQVVEGDQAVRKFLEMPGTFKCADALGFHQTAKTAGPRRVTVAESKGTDMNSAVEQLGNAAAGVLEKFGRETKLDLLVVVPSLVERPSGSLSPGHGYRADPRRTGRNMFTLQESIGGPPLQARPRVTYPGWTKWSHSVGTLSIVVLVMNN
jgi:hypothetical protein